MGVRPHDLLRLRSAAAIEAVDLPHWAAAAFAAAPWVVVRRAGETGDRIAVGLRGTTRSERFAAHVPPAAVAETARPEDLARRPSPRDHPAFAALETLRPVLDELGASWGPAGAAGFELASGRPTLTDDSDLDLVLRFGRPPDVRALDRLASAACEAPLRVDILIEAPAGAVAFGEFRSPAADVLLRTREGPRLAARAELWPGC